MERFRRQLKRMIRKEGIGEDERKAMKEDEEKAIKEEENKWSG
jgi:hypothetical protein